MARPLAFVIMPFSSTETCDEREWSNVFQTIFRPTLDGLGYDCERAMPTSGSLIGSIIEKLKTAHIVLADVTDRNPNVFYELGVRHSLRRGTIIVSQVEAHVPSDLKGYWYVKYDTHSWDLEKFTADISRAVREINARTDRSDSPVGDYLGIEQLGLSSLVQKENLKKLIALRTELTGNLVELSRVSESHTRSLYFQDECLGLLLSTLYVDPGPKVLLRAYEFRWKLRIISEHLDKEIVDLATEDATWLLAEVNAAVTHFQAGSFFEPSTITSMIWTRAPRDDSSVRSLHGSHVGSISNRIYKQALYSSIEPLVVPFDAKKLGIDNQSEDGDASSGPNAPKY